MSFDPPMWLWLTFASFWIAACLYSLKWIEDYGREWVFVQVHMMLTIPVGTFISVGIYCTLFSQYVVR